MEILGKLQCTWELETDYHKLLGISTSEGSCGHHFQTFEDSRYKESQ